MLPFVTYIEELPLERRINVKSFIIDDDVAVKDSSYTVGRRGVAATFSL